MGSAILACAFDQFSHNRLFEGLDPDVLEKIAPGVGIISLREGEVIFREGEQGDSLYLIGEGSVKISKIGRGGKQETLGVVRSGDFFGEMALLDGQPRSAMAMAAEPTVLGTVGEETFEQIVELAPSRLHINFLRSVTQRLRSVNTHFINEVMRTERLSLVGNPNVKDDWYVNPKTGEPVDFITFARSEGRFAKHFDKDGNPSAVLLAANQDRLENWHVLQELAGLR